MFRFLSLLPAMALALGLLETAPSATADERGKAARATAQHYEVTMKGNKFDQADLTIAVGDTVRWVNDDNGKHSTTPDTEGAPWTEMIVEGGAHSDRVTFAKAGTYEYHCKFHGTMKGKITVK